MIPHPYHLHISMSKRGITIGLDAVPRTGVPRGLLCVLCAVLGCRPDANHEPLTGCTKDVDCKGARICVDQLCVDPEPKGALQGQAAEPAQPDDSWRRGGPAGDRPSRGRGPLEAPKAAWEADLGSVVFARPTLGTDTEGRTVAYVGTHAGRFVGVLTDGDGAGTIVTDLTVGGMVWSTAARDARGRLYVGADDDTLYAIDPGSSKIAWSKKLGNCAPARAPGPEGARCDVDGGPTLGPDGDLYVGADGVYRVTTAGEIVWHWPTDVDRPKHVFSSPLVTEDGLVVFGGQDGFVTALDTADGTQKWRYKVGADVDGSAAAGIDGSVYIGADDGRMFALRTDGSLKWSFVAQSDIRSSVAVAPDGTIYLSSFDGNMYSLDPAGNVRWMLPTGGRIAASPVLDADGVVYVGSQDDRLYAVTAEGKVRWNVEFPTDIDSSVAITPAGTLVVGSDDGTLRGLR